MEGKVTLPKPEVAAALPPRYQSESIAVAAPESPTAVVYLESDVAGAGGGAATNGPARMEQMNLQFRTGLLPVQKGTTVEFPNLDEGYHNVFSYSKIKRFDLGRYRKDEKPAWQIFDKAGVVKVYCEIHPHMRSTILVLDTPYFVKTDTNGNFRLDHLPAGKFTLKAWLSEKVVLEQSVDLASGKTARVDFPSK